MVTLDASGGISAGQRGKAAGLSLRRLTGRSGCGALRCMSHRAFGNNTRLGKRRIIPGRLAPDPEKGRYLVDPASSHMLVSKIKPCMSKYKLFYTVKTANGSLNQL